MPLWKNRKIYRNRLTKLCYILNILSKIYWTIIHLIHLIHRNMTQIETLSKSIVEKAKAIGTSIDQIVKESTSKSSGANNDGDKIPTYSANTCLTQIKLWIANTLKLTSEKQAWHFNEILQQLPNVVNQVTQLNKQILANQNKLIRCLNMFGDITEQHIKEYQTQVRNIVDTSQKAVDKCKSKLDFAKQCQHDAETLVSLFKHKAAQAAQTAAEEATQQIVDKTDEIITGYTDLKTNIVNKNRFHVRTLRPYYRGQYYYITKKEHAGDFKNTLWISDDASEVYLYANNQMYNYNTPTEIGHANNLDTFAWNIDDLYPQNDQPQPELKDNQITTEQITELRSLRQKYADLIELCKTLKNNVADDLLKGLVNKLKEKRIPEKKREEILEAVGAAKGKKHEEILEAVGAAKGGTHLWA